MAVERWTDEMLDELTLSMKELIGVVRKTSQNIDMLIDAVNALLQREQQREEENRLRQEVLQQDRLAFQQYKQENDQRFEVLLAEVQFLIRQLSEQVETRE